MVDFIEYVVGELKSKRLSAGDAAVLVKQFSLRSSGTSRRAFTHPLLHDNTSDLRGQRYRSTFTGDEFFLVDHQVRVGEEPGQKVLPGVAYLEMAREAMAQSWPRPDATLLELRNVVWARPVVVDGSTQVSLAVAAVDDDQIDFEIYSQDGQQESVHCQGRAVWSRQQRSARLDIERLKEEMGRGALRPTDIYDAFARMGLIYGPAFQGIATLHRGSGQVLAELRLPKGVQGTSADYVLHPSLMDSALQAAVGLFAELSELASDPPLPFALDSLRVEAPCPPAAMAWVRYSPGSQADDPVVKLDVDLCDELGNVCVQMHGVSTRVLNRETGVVAGRRAATSTRPEPLPLQPEPIEQRAELDAEGLSRKTEDYLRRQFSGLLKVQAQEIDPRAPLETYGIDSILAMKLTNQMESTFGSLSKTLFFEYQTIRELAEYFIEHYSAEMRALFTRQASRANVAVAPTRTPPPAPAESAPSRRFARPRAAIPVLRMESDPIAIIGLSGRYPGAVDLDAYWRNLRDGKDCIVEVPKERWDWRAYFSDDRGKSGHHYSKWGGFIEGVAEFDPLFFNISPLEAELIDPQERLFLQHVWMAVEDAGYTRAGLQVPCEQDLAGQVGVYVGVMYSEYQLFGAEASMRGQRVGIAGSVASIANRVSYWLNVHGPSMTLDTMCSSSLTAIHLACQDLKQGRTSMAIAGGVNVSIHPNKYLALSAGQFISGDGHCQSFGEGGDGYIPGEGVGVVVLKRLSEAERDGDHIYGIIRGHALTHGGKTNGYTVPSPQAQTSAISRALAESGTDARHVSYIEAHGTGTKLGDPIEIAALSKAFHRDTQDAEFCLIGSVKSNIGHCESAAGVAGLTKVLLQMQHREIVPSLHSAELNPHIDFGSSPFVVNQSLRSWEPPVVDGRTLPRIAGISSFGAGGSNAHMIVEEYQSPASQPMALAPFAVVLSARTVEQLQQKAGELLDFVRGRMSAIDLGALAYTLQVGREAMEERLGLVVSSAQDLVEKLQAYGSGEQGIEDSYRGQVKRNREALSVFGSDADLQQTIDKWFANRKLAKLLDLWVKGLELDWRKLYGEERPRRVSLPTYPFARERYWIDTAANAPATNGGAATAFLHPLLHSNASDLSEQRYRTTLTGDEFFLADHQVKMDGVTGAKVLPGVACLEMARAAIEEAVPARPEAVTVELRDVVWVQPIVVTEARKVTVAVSATSETGIDFEIYSNDTEEERVHCQGRAVLVPALPAVTLDLDQLAGQMERGTLEPTSLYAACARMGLVYGPSFQGITSIRQGRDQVLAHLRLPAALEGASSDYVLHPSLMDGALQAAVGLMDSVSEGSEARLPFALETLRILSGCSREMVAWVRYAPGSHSTDTVVKLEIDLCDRRGNVCVQMDGLSLRAVDLEARSAKAEAKSIGMLMATPAWQVADAPASGGAGVVAYAEHHVILCEGSTVRGETLQSLMPEIQLRSLEAGDDANIAQRYSQHALACFERVQSILRGKPQGRVLIQIVAADHGERALFAGLSGLLRTAALENPKLSGQLILVPPDVSAEELAAYLETEKHGAPAPLVRYQQDVRTVLGWDTSPAALEPSPSAFRDAGVYLITGGLGGLGVLFAREILDRAEGARVVLTGRSSLSGEKQALLDGLSAHAGRISYRQVDLGDAEQVKQLIAGIQQEHGRLDGILHSAGMIADAFILKKDGTELLEVLAPKVTGTINLDDASQQVELDFFVLFSSIAGAMGNPGQADYATANGFLDQFAAYRNLQVAARQRHGRTRSIGWPLWEAGGMGIDAAGREMLRQATGMQPMRTAAGLAAFHRCLALPHGQLLVMEGEIDRMRLALRGAPAVPSAPPVTQPAIVSETASSSLAEKTQGWLRTQLSSVLKLPAHKIDPETVLEEYGIDSILAMKLTSELEKTFGPLSKTLFFEYQTIAALAAYLAKAYPAIVRDALGLLQGVPKAAESGGGLKVVPKRAAPAIVRRNRFIGAQVRRDQDIAIIGLAGRYPQAENLQELWKNLQGGRDCITEIPPERWDHTLYFDPDPSKLGKSYSKWGGFIAGVDQFDPLFFNISPKEAALIDPQERLFLETAWQTIEDAGYTKERIAGSRVGVYVGVMWGQYELFGAESILNGDAAVPSSSHASIANRVSYFFDLHGPSIALDTMCSSSLTAIHLACEELRRGEIDAALAGGVNVSIHPHKYLSLSQGKFAASDGRCRSFGAGGDGYVPGEGVGAVLLKPLDSALRDGDRVYAVIKSSTVNHGGKTNGYTVPNPNAQGDLIGEALRKGGIDPRTVSYVETHGTGTSLGDPIEITGLMKAFGDSSDEKQFCPIGSVKSNIGHLESAAGIAAVTKAILQIRHKQLVPSIHAEPLNPHIDFESSPFYVQTELTEWKHAGAHPRRVGVSSFGAGGSNAHLILEEHAEEPRPESVWHPMPFLLSAKDRDALVRYAERTIAFLDGEPGLSLADVAYTSQVGRTPMDARLAILASSVEELTLKLRRWVARGAEDDISEGPDLFYGNLREARFGGADLIGGPAGKTFLENLLVGGDLEKIARLWVLGVDIDWSLLYREGSPRRISLATYPFARERHWIRPGPVTPRLPLNVVTDEGAGAQPKPLEEKERTYFAVEWAAKPIPADADRRLPAGPILMLNAPEELTHDLKEQLGASLVVVNFGESFQELGPDLYVIDPEREEPFHELVRLLESRSLLPAAVVHHAGAPCDLADQKQVAQGLNHGIYPLFHLSRALMAAKHHSPVRILSVFSGHGEEGAPLGAALGGFLKTLTLENPKYRTRVVEVPDGVSSAEAAALIRDELCEPDWSAQEIRYRRSVEMPKAARFVSRFVQQTPVERTAASLPLRQKGVYLITGGLGQLGLVVADYLARNFQADLVLLGRSAPNARQEAILAGLELHGAQILCLRADVSQRSDLERAVGEAKARFGRIDGVFHAAGVNRDAFILKKSREEMEAVLAPKVYGAINVDLATSGEPLDLFVLFSSVAGVTGNVGQCDYAYGNRFLDAFAVTREGLRAAQTRSGRTRSIDWPFWEEGGMVLSAEDLARLERDTGICPLPTGEGIQYLEDFLRSDAVQGVALYGIPSRIAAYLTPKDEKSDRRVPAPAGIDNVTLFTRTETYLKTLIGEEINLSPDRISSSDRFESFGIDSVVINHFNARLERDLGALPKTLLYEYETVKELATFLVQEARETLIARLGSGVPSEEPFAPLTAIVEAAVRLEVSPVTVTEGDSFDEPIAIIGIHGRYPQSATLADYWENLKQGRDLTEPVPASRWDAEALYHPDPAAAADGKIYHKWGAFLDDHDKFDPRFFNITAEEARIMDPQERLFLQSVWSAIEDAGYTRDSLKRRFPKARSADVGVFVGVTTNSYHLLQPDEGSGAKAVHPSSLPWSIANRVSYFFDFNGPSMPIDTACSSSLVAIHLACESLKRRECQIAVAGGVNLYLHPSKYQALCQKRMLSTGGQCHSYGAGEDGFVPGEGVGTVVLKPLSRAIADRDRIHGVIAASAYDHSGRSNGYSAPNPGAQASLISRTLKKAAIHPESVSYVEGHGTGTRLGDSLEIAALTQAFRGQTAKDQFCSVGSVKANIGHSESAAGIAGLAKVLLQMEHRQLAPSIHSDEVNPEIELAGSPFYLQHGLSEWAGAPDHPRRALINSFGAGGVNACLVVEEFQPQAVREEAPTAGPCILPISAKSDEQLREYAGRLLLLLKTEPQVDLGSLCYTFQVGREAMEERLALVVTSVEEAIERLDAWIAGGAADELYRGSLGPRRGSSRRSRTVMAEESLSAIASSWVAGEELDWESLYPSAPPRRIAAPTYPFARERYWVSDSPQPERRLSAPAQLHPLISYNSSTLKEVSFTSVLSEGGFYAVDHQVNDEKIFPGAGFLEMACLAGNLAGEQRVRKIIDIVWSRPLSFKSGSQTLRTLLKPAGDGAEYVISSLSDENEAIPHSEGRLLFRNRGGHAETEDRESIQALKEQCARPEEGAAYYDRFRRAGLSYGPAFRTIQEIYLTGSFALSRLKISEHLRGDFAQFILHPSMIDGALQTVAGLVGGLDSPAPYVPFALDEVEIIEPVPRTCYAVAEFADAAEENYAGIKKFNIRLLSESGDVLMKFRNLFVRALTPPDMVRRAPIGFAAKR